MAPRLLVVDDERPIREDGWENECCRASLRNGGAHRHHHGNRFAHIADLAGGDHRLLEPPERLKPLLAREESYDQAAAALVRRRAAE